MQVYSPPCPRSPGRQKHPCYLQGGQVPSISRSPCFTPHLRAPFLPCPTILGPRGKHRRACGTSCPLGPGRPPAVPLAQPRSLVEFDLSEPWV